MTIKSGKIKLDKLTDNFGNKHHGKIVPANDGDLNIEVYFDCRTSLQKVTLAKGDLLNLEMADKRFKAEVSSYKKKASDFTQRPR